MLPQSVTANAVWRLNPRWMLALQGDWVNWNDAFQTLPVMLRGGNNALVNSLVNSTSLNDGVPLDWKSQFSVRAGFERMLTELSPLTVAILSNQFSTGIGWRHGRANIDGAYSFDPLAKSTVGQSALLSGEYDNSAVKIANSGRDVVDVDPVLSDPPAPALLFSNRWLAPFDHETP